MTPEEVDQYARGFIMFLFGPTLFTDQANTVPLCLLSALVDVRRIRRYDWGGAGLATLYGYMSFSSRLSGQLLGGYWRAWEVRSALFDLHFYFSLLVHCTWHTLLSVLYILHSAFCTPLYILYTHSCCLVSHSYGFMFTS